MTKKELIKLLEKMPDDAEILLIGPGNYARWVFDAGKGHERRAHHRIRDIHFEAPYIIMERLPNPGD